MKREPAQLLSAALRSGQYPQGSAQLAYVGHVDKTVFYCCLGVLCEVAIENGVDVTKTHDGKLKEYLYDEEPTAPPKSVKDWAGLSDDLVDRMIGWNDTQNFTFNQIASFIDRMKYDDD